MQHSVKNVLELFHVFPKFSDFFLVESSNLMIKQKVKSSWIFINFLNQTVDHIEKFLSLNHSFLKIWQHEIQNTTVSNFKSSQLRFFYFIFPSAINNFFVKINKNSSSCTRSQSCQSAYDEKRALIRWSINVSQKRCLCWENRLASWIIAGSREMFFSFCRASIFQFVQWV